MEKLPVYFIPHGGGPWHVINNAMGDPIGYGRLREYLENFGEQYSQMIKAILVVSGHWEEDLPTLQFGSNPPLLYDYYGFPESTYHLKWPAPGNPDLAERIEKLLHLNGFETKRAFERGFDHGTFVPLMIAFPEANIPVVQLSLVNSLDPETHINIGKVLEPLRNEGVLIIGSGMSYHNMRGFMSGSSSAASISTQFDEWLTQTVEINDTKKRNEMLVNWEDAPKARESHPRSEHLIPLFVAAGAAGSDKGSHDYSGLLMGIKVSGYKFG
ncbi:MAG: class III extradiol ring-cleavage dioxygenase [Salinivirgaceae bacterium]|nr:class III extradiol ring-cleavage dioxygenase [Salinivirgaceae bacterium]